MKFLTTLGFFASAMALTTSPVKKSNLEQPGLYDLVVATPGYVNTRREPNSEFNLAHMFSLLSYRQEPEAVSSHERLRRETTTATVRVPYDVRLTSSVVAAGITIVFTMSRVKHYAFFGTKEKMGFLCTKLRLHNPTSSNLVINILHSSGDVLWKNIFLPMGQIKDIDSTHALSDEEITVRVDDA